MEYVSNSDESNEEYLSENNEETDHDLLQTSTTVRTAALDIEIKRNAINQ